MADDPDRPEAATRDLPVAARDLPEAARRALAEAAERRAARDAAASATSPTPEQGGRGGLDPVRYDDWEVGGVAVDF